MNLPCKPDHEMEERIAARLLDVLIRAGLILAMVLLCYRVFSPFLTLMVWALILAVTTYPLHQSLARRIGGRQGLAATLLVLVGSVAIIAPTALLVSSLGDSGHQLIEDVPPPRVVSGGTWPSRSGPSTCKAKLVIGSVER